MSVLILTHLAAWFHAGWAPTGPYAYLTPPGLALGAGRLANGAAYWFAQWQLALVHARGQLMGVIR